MHDLEARLIHDSLWIEYRICWQTGCCNGGGSGGVRVVSAGAVCVDVQLDLANAFVQLLIQRTMPVFKRLIEFEIFLLKSLDSLGAIPAW